MKLRHILSIANRRYHFRDAITGEFVSRLYALAHPWSTIREQAH